jgi:hypothetical protein
MAKRKDSFGGRFDASFKAFSDKINKQVVKSDFSVEDNPFDFEPTSQSQISRIRFYNHDSMWNRWRRGYELYTLTQTVLGTSAKNRNTRGDFRMYCAFEQFPGVFIPARMFTFPSSNSEIGEQMVGVRDVNSINFYSFGLPILNVRYLQTAKSGQYVQSGTTLTVTINSHGYVAGDSLYLDIETGAALNETLTVVSATTNTFVCTASTSLTTTGNLTASRVTSFTDPLWTQQRVEVQSIPTVASFLQGERLVDRVVERDPGLSATYSSTGYTVTVTCSSAHGLSTGVQVLLSMGSGSVQSGLYNVTVLNSTQFTVTTVTSASTTGSLTVQRRIRGYDYNNYVGYTSTGVDLATNEILFQRDDSYGTRMFDPVTNLPSPTGQGVPKTVVPAHRGFIVGRYLTTEVRYQCTCQDYLKRETYNFYKEQNKRKFPNTLAGSVRPGFNLNRDGTLVPTRDDVGVYSDFGYVVINNFYQLPGYEDDANLSRPLLAYYQLRWCKHIYAAMWSLVHDEGNDPFNLTAYYTQSGPNITLKTTEPHGLSLNTRVNIDFKGGTALAGEYVVSQVIDDNNFVIIYPFSETTSGYCTITNLKPHEYVGTWLLEPNDPPVGDSAEFFYKKLEKENESLRRAAERLIMMGYGMPWIGSKSITGNRNLPAQSINFDTNLVTQMVTDSIRRNPQYDPNDLNSNRLSETGIPVNTTTTMLTVMQKMLNIDMTLIQSAKFGMLDQPLIDYADNFRTGEIECGTYLNGNPLDYDSSTGTRVTETLNCGTYTNGVPTTPTTTQIDCGTYIST